MQTAFDMLLTLMGMRAHLHERGIQVSRFRFSSDPETSCLSPRMKMIVT